MYILLSLFVAKIFHFSGGLCSSFALMSGAKIFQKGSSLLPCVISDV